MPPKNIKAPSKTNKVKEDSDEEIVKTTQSISKTKKVEEVSDEEIESDNNSEDDSNNTSESESESENKEKKTKEKKVKESFEELTKKLEILQSNMKDVEKEITDLQKQIESRVKYTRDLKRQMNSINKIFLKTHNEEVIRALKSKPKRKGNINGGFNKELPIPVVLCKFLNLPEETCMARPKVFSGLNNKLTELGLRNGQNITIDKSTAKALCLGEEYYNKQIKFNEFQSFLASFYPKKEIKEIEA